MKLSELLPPGDLLKQVEGIETGLRQRYRLGYAGLIAALTQIAVLLAGQDWFSKFVADKKYWPLVLILAGVVASLVFAGWARFWLEESKAPFRYTYSIADFKPVIGEKDVGGKEDKLSVHLSHDLAQRLNERIRRLSLLDDEHVKARVETQAKQPEAAGKSHIHISGHYIIRESPGGEHFVEVLPRVRIGPGGSPETLAHAVKFKLPNGSSVGATARPALSPRQYDQIVERVYFSVATEIYEQIQQDVKRKIDLLPNDYYRAVAYLYEAEDYARSNTLDAYKEAKDLYKRAMEGFDPSLRRLLKSRFPRFLQRSFRWLHERKSRLDMRLARWMPRFGRVVLLCAKAEMGYANMLLYRAVLAVISAQRVNAVFEARPVAKRALEKLEGLPEDVEGLQDALFDANVTLALAWLRLQAIERAQDCLKKCLAMNPGRAEEDARYLYVAGDLETHRGAKLEYYQRAVELDPRFDVARFSRAIEMEMDWRKTLEPNVAEIVIQEYEKVLSTNPGIVGAWTNIGYVRWLLGDNANARAAFDYGREYKEIKNETYVAELDYGLARIAAEEGDFERAYEHVESGISALIAQGHKFSPARSSELYHYTFINKRIMERFEGYKERVTKNRNAWVAENALIDDLMVGRKRGLAVKVLTASLKESARKVSLSDRENLKRWIEVQPVGSQVKAWLSEGDLELFAAQIEENQCDGALLGDLQKILLDDTFVGLMRKHLPKPRILDSVLAFALDDYGNACYAYFNRVGEGNYETLAQAAYKEATRRDGEFVLPWYHLYNYNITRKEKYLEKIRELEPNWPDGKMAEMLWLVSREFRKRIEESRLQAAEHEQDAEKKRAEAQGHEDEARQKQNDLTRIRADLKREQDKLERRQEELTEKQDQREGDNDEANKIISLKFRGAKVDQAMVPDLPGFTNEIKNLQTQADLLYKEIEKLQQRASIAKKKADDLKQKASDLKESANDRETGAESQVEKHLNDLVPHDWLSIHHDNIDAFQCKAFNVELKWEREFNDLHALALLTWIQARAQLLRNKKTNAPAASAATNQAASGSTATSSGTTKRGMGVQDIERLLDHFQTHFWPDNFDCLYIAYGLKKDANDKKRVESLGVKIRSAIESWLQSDPYLVISGWVPDEVFDGNARKKLYRGVAKRTDLSEQCYRLLGDKLVELGSESDAFDAYRRISQSDEHARKLIGDELLNELEDHARKLTGDELLIERKTEQCLSAYRAAMKTSNPALLLELADAFGRLKRWNESLKACRRGRECDVNGDTLSHPASEYSRRIARYLLLIENEEALNELDTLGAHFAQEGTRWRESFVQDSTTDITSARSYRILKDWLDRELLKCMGANDLEGELDVRRASLILSREEYFNETDSHASSIPMMPVVTPVAIEADSNLFTDSAAESDLNLVLERVHEKTGIKIAGKVRFRGNDEDFLKHSYIILINEVPIVLGKVEHGRKFCPLYNSLPPSFNSSGGIFNPQTGENDGAWVSEAEAEQIEAAGGVTWSYLQYVAGHLEAVMISDLTPFVGLQEVHNLLYEWRALNESDAERRRLLVDDVLPDLDARLEFMQILRGLVKEGVPITDLSAILQCFQKARLDGHDLFEMIEAVRLTLKGTLRQNDTSMKFVYLSRDFEEEIHTWSAGAGGKRFFAIPAEQTQELLTAFRNAVDEIGHSRVVVVTQMPGIRPFVRRLIEIEFPRVAVLSSQELRGDLRGRVSATIEYQR